MQIENDYDKEVYNGDLGVVSRIDVEESGLTVDFDGREVIYGFTELDELVLAYATTIHKSQGSEYPAVVIPLTTQHYVMLQRNLAYTGVTRGKRWSRPSDRSRDPTGDDRSSMGVQSEVSCARLRLARFGYCHQTAQGGGPRGQFGRQVGPCASGRRLCL